VKVRLDAPAVRWMSKADHNICATATTIPCADPTPGRTESQHDGQTTDGAPQQHSRVDVDVGDLVRPSQPYGESVSATAIPNTPLDDHQAGHEASVRAKMLCLCLKRCSARTAMVVQWVLGIAVAPDALAVRLGRAEPSRPTSTSTRLCCWGRHQ